MLAAASCQLGLRPCLPACIPAYVRPACTPPLTPGSRRGPLPPALPQKDYEEPLAHTHFKAEGDVEFKAVLFVPSAATPGEPAGAQPGPTRPA